MLIGYARISTPDQSLDLQKDALVKAGCRETFEDVASGPKASRAGLDQALKYLRRGDTLIVWRLDRLERSLRHMVDIVAGAGLVCAHCREHRHGHRQWEIVPACIWSSHRV